MAVCAYGASVKPGVNGDTYVPIDASAVTALGFLPLPWWSAVFAYLLMPFEQKVSAICSANSDDPSPPGVDVWAAAVVFGNPSATAQIHDFLVAKITYMQFQANCVCNSGPGYTPDACGPGVYYDGSGGLFGPVNNPVWTPIPAGATHLKCHVGSCSGANCHSPYGVGMYTGIPGTVSHLIATDYDPANVYTWTIPGGDTHYCGEAYGGANTISTCWSFDSGTGVTTPVAPTTVVQPPTLLLPGAATCASYQDVCNVLQQLNLKLDWLQQATPPVNYLRRVTPSTVHYPLTGQADIVVSGILGVLVTLNVVPSSYGSQSGRPPQRFDVGRVSWSDAYGLVGEQWIGSTTELLMPLTVTLVSYWFAPGVQATITELIAGK